MTEDLENRVAELERLLAATVARWNSFIDPKAGGVTRPRVAEIERRITEMVSAFNEHVGSTAAAEKAMADELLKVIDKVVGRFKRIEAKLEEMESRCFVSYRGVWAGVV